MSIEVKKPSIFPVILVTIGVFSISFLILAVVGLSPESITPTPIKHNQEVVSNLSEVIDINSNSYTRPDRIIIDKVGIDSVINKPNTGDVAILDQALLSGAVHYPGSGSIERGNMFLFGHSTNWKVVQNQAYKTFNNLQELEIGDEIEIVANGETYIYRVNSVILVDEDDALVEFDSSNRSLTISTCNTFGEKQERWVVNADFYKKA